MRLPERDDVRRIVARVLGLKLPAVETADAITDSIIDHLTWRIDGDGVITNIIKFVCELYGTNYELLKGKSRKREIVEARHVAMYLLTRYTPMSLKRIGMHFGNRDHSTVIHARRTVRDLSDTNKYYREKLQKCITFADQLVYTNDHNKAT